MITIILITAIFLLINGIPFMRICLGRWPWQRTLALVAVGCAIVSYWSFAFGSRGHAGPGRRLSGR